MNIYKWATSRKYRMFTRKIRDVQTNMWEYEFKIAKSRQVREGVRQDRDRSLENVQQIETILKTEIRPEVVAKITDDKAKHLENAGRYERQMKMIDDQINGVVAIPATAENPEGNPGQEGIIGIIASLLELKNMYTDYRRSI